MTLIDIIQLIAWIIVIGIIIIMVVREFNMVYKNTYDAEDVVEASKLFSDAGCLMKEKPIYPLFDGKPVPAILKEHLDLIYHEAYQETVKWNAKCPSLAIVKRPILNNP